MESPSSSSFKGGPVVPATFERVLAIESEHGTSTAFNDGPRSRGTAQTKGEEQGVVASIDRRVRVARGRGSA